MPPCSPLCFPVGLSSLVCNPPASNPGLESLSIQLIECHRLVWSTESGMKLVT